MQLLHVARNIFLSVIDYNLAQGFNIENIENLRFPFEIIFTIADEYRNSTVFIAIDGNIFYQSPVTDLYDSEINNTQYYVISKGFNEKLLEVGILRDFNNSKMTFNLDDTQIGEISLQYRPAFCPPVKRGFEDGSIIVMLIIIIVIVATSVYFLRKKK